MYIAKRSKRLLSVLLSLALLLSSTALFAAAADEETFAFVKRYEQDDTLWIDGFTGEVPAALVIPVEDNKLTCISDNAFAGAQGLVELTLPKGVDSVGEKAFADCVNLQVVTIDSAWVFEGAFHGCNALKTLNITTYDHVVGSISDRWGADNEPLWNAEHNWVNYLDWETWDNAEDYTCKVGEGLFVYSAFDTADMQDATGYEFHWYYAGGPDDVFYIDDEQMSGLRDAAFVRTYSVGTEYLCCAVTDADGIVVFQEQFGITAQPTLKWRVQQLWYNSLLYRLISILRYFFDSVFHS